MKISDNFADVLYEYYCSLNIDEFDKACEDTLQEVIRQDDQYVAKIDQSIK